MSYRTRLTGKKREKEEADVQQIDFFFFLFSIINTYHLIEGE